MLECYIYIIDFQQLANRHQPTKDKLLKFTHYRASTFEVFFNWAKTKDSSDKKKTTTTIQPLHCLIIFFCCFIWQIDILKSLSSNIVMNGDSSLKIHIYLLPSLSTSSFSVLGACPALYLHTYKWSIHKLPRHSNGFKNI